MQIAIKPFHGWRLPAKFIEQIPELKEPLQIPDKSIYHQEALPALYLYQAFKDSQQSIYSGLLGINTLAQSPNDFHWKPVPYNPIIPLSILNDCLIPWSKHPEIIIKDLHGIRHQISVIQTFPIIQDILQTISEVEFECLNPEAGNINPFVCIAFNNESVFPDSFPIGQLIAPIFHAENTSPYSAGF